MKRGLEAFVLAAGVMAIVALIIGASENHVSLAPKINGEMAALVGEVNATNPCKDPAGTAKKSFDECMAQKPGRGAAACQTVCLQACTSLFGSNGYCRQGTNGTGDVEHKACIRQCEKSTGVYNRTVPSIY